MEGILINKATAKVFAVMKNIEKKENFYINDYFYKNRKRGISAMIRCKNEEDFIKPCIQSIEHFFDEIIVALNNCTDKTEDKLKEINSDKIKIVYYPHELHYNGPGHDNIPENSVYDNSYYYNWVLGQTSYSHVCKWDADMVAMSSLNKKIRKLVLQSQILFIHGFEIAGKELTYFSRERKIVASEPRFFKVDKNTIYKQGKFTQYLSYPRMGMQKKIEKSLFLHFKYSKNFKTATQIWPRGWNKLDHFKNLIKRAEKGRPFEGEMPKALKKKIFDMAVDSVSEVENIKSQISMYNTIFDLLFELRNTGLQGNLLKVGAKVGKTTRFVSKAMESLFPVSFLHSIDSFSLDKVHYNLDVKCVEKKNIGNRQYFKNHNYVNLPSSQGIKNSIKEQMIFSLIDCEHTYEGVLNDFYNVLRRTKKGGIIVLDDIDNVKWAQVTKAYDRIKNDFNVALLKKNGTCAVFRKKKNFSILKLCHIIKLAHLKRY